jgi:hypothetical protein
MFTNDPNYQPNNGEKRAKNRNKLTTDSQVSDMALTLWECEDYLRRSMLKNNLNSYFRDRLVRLLSRLAHEAKKLGQDLDQPNETAFESLTQTKSTAKLFGVN